jgi:hypothetical protein
VVDQHAGRRARCGGQRFEPIREALVEGVVGTRFEEPLPDLRLPLPTHDASFSRNDRYV